MLRTLKALNMCWLYFKNMSLLDLQIKMLSFKVIFKWKVSHVPLFFLCKPCVCTSREKAIIWLPIKFPWSWENTEAITLQHSGYWKAECLHRVLWKNADCIVYSHLIALVQNNYTLLNTRFLYPQPAFLKLCHLCEDRFWHYEIQFHLVLLNTKAMFKIRAWAFAMTV